MDVEQVLTVTVLGIAALIGILIMGQVGGTLVDVGVTAGDAEIEGPTVGQTETLDKSVEERPHLLDVKLTTEYGVELSGENSYIDAQAPTDWSNESWTSCAVGALDQDANQKDTFALVAYDNESINIHYDNGEWAAIYYNNSTSARATLPANSPTALTPVCARHNSTADTLEIHVDGTTSAPVDMTSSQATRSTSSDWDGTVDEVRLFPAVVDDADLASYSAEPAAPIDASHSARYMFDEGSGGTTSPYYHNSDADLVNVAWVTGVTGPGLEEGTDYDVGFNPLEVTPLSGGLIEGAPVLHVDWDSGLGAAMQSIQSGAGDALGLVGTVLVIMIASALVAVVGRFR